MKDLGYGRGYQYDPAVPGGLAKQRYLPESLEGIRFYEPTGMGHEAVLRDRMARWQALRDGPAPDGQPSGSAEPGQDDQE